MTAKTPDRSPAAGRPAEDLPQALAEIRAALARQEQAAAEQHESLQATLAGLTEQLDGLAERLLGPPGSTPATVLRPSTLEQPVSFERPGAVVVPEVVESRTTGKDSGPEGDSWSELLLGSELAGDERAADDGRQLLDDARDGDLAALGLVGQMLVFRAAASERLPVLLKDVGEAWYRWRPAGSPDDPLLEGLIQMLEAACAMAGAANRIELVHVGDRYDSARHNTRDRGIEVSAVYGWVVLRENGSVYTKASVSVK